MTTHQLTLEEGLARQSAGVAVVESHAGDWLDAARASARRLAQERGRVTIDDVRAVAGPPPADLHRNAMGAVFAGREWVCVDRVRSCVASNHARKVNVYALRKEN